MERTAVALRIKGIAIRDMMNKQALVPMTAGGIVAAVEMSIAPAMTTTANAPRKIAAMGLSIAPSMTTTANAGSKVVAVRQRFT